MQTRRTSQHKAKLTLSPRLHVKPLITVITAITTDFCRCWNRVQNREFSLRAKYNTRSIVTEKLLRGRPYEGREESQNKSGIRDPPASDLLALHALVSPLSLPFKRLPRRLRSDLTEQLYAGIKWIKLSAL